MLFEWVYEILNEKKCTDIATLKPRNEILVEKYVLATVNNSSQMNAVRDALNRRARDNQLHIRVDGEPESEWIIIDFGGELVHLLTDRMRRIYNLEELGVAEDG